MHPNNPMDNKRLAVIDLGSNTFHLLIADRSINPPHFKKIFNKRSFVYLLGDGYAITNDAYLRSKKTLLEFKDVLVDFNVSDVQVIGTAALRNTPQIEAFRKLVREILSTEIKVISGDEELEYILKGTMAMDLEFKEMHMLMDIGGGSVELGVFNHEGLKCGISVPLGISKMRYINNSDKAYTSEEISQLSKYCNRYLSPFIKHAEIYNPVFLIGSSGPFEILENINVLKASSSGNSFNSKYVKSLAQDIILKSYDERKAIKGMKSSRADLSRESFFLIQLILSYFNKINEVIVSPYALKEGVVCSVFN